MYSYIVILLLLWSSFAYAEDALHEALHQGMLTGQAQINSADNALREFSAKTEIPYSATPDAVQYYTSGTSRLEQTAIVHSQTEPASVAVKESHDIRPKYELDVTTDPTLRRAISYQQGISDTAAQLQGQYGNCVAQNNCQTTYTQKDCHDIYAYATITATQERQVHPINYVYPNPCFHMLIYDNQNTTRLNQFRTHDPDIPGIVRITTDWWWGINRWHMLAFLVPGPDESGLCVAGYHITRGVGNNNPYGLIYQANPVVPTHFPATLKLSMIHGPVYVDEYGHSHDYGLAGDQFDVYLNDTSNERHFQLRGAYDTTFDLSIDHSQNRAFTMRSSVGSRSYSRYQQGIAQVLVPQQVGPIVNESEDTWLEHSESLSGRHCHLTGEERCISGAGTRVIDGLSVTRGCWQQERNYQCEGMLTQNESTCTPLRAQGCEQMSSQCAARDGGSCLDYLQSYRCPIEQCTATSVTCLGDTICLDGSCGQQDYQKNTDFNQAMAALSAMTNAAKQLQGNNPGIFKGESKSCRTTFIGFSNCCSDSGWGLDLNLTNCHQEEQELGQAKQNNLTVFVGEYCAHRVLGFCTERKRTSCVFSSKLARLIQQQGRQQQLGIGFGSGEEPNCSALTPEQLQQLDFSKIDFHEIYDELRQRMVVPHLDGGLQPATKVEALQAKVKTNQPQCEGNQC